jgi:hypothetical protein
VLSTSSNMFKKCSGADFYASREAVESAYTPQCRFLKPRAGMPAIRRSLRPRTYSFDSFDSFGFSPFD